MKIRTSNEINWNLHWAILFRRLSSQHLDNRSIPFQKCSQCSLWSRTIRTSMSRIITSTSSISVSSRIGLTTHQMWRICCSLSCRWLATIIIGWGTENVFSILLIKIWIQSNNFYSNTPIIFTIKIKLTPLKII